jgi:hypothetical protein
MDKRLEHFARTIMHARDASIKAWDMTVDGSMKSTHVAQRLKGFTPDQLEALRWLIPQIVDTTLHHVLWGIERDEDVDVTITGRGGDLSLQKNVIPDLAVGLHAELYGDSGWIRRFSEQRRVDPLET